MNLSMTDEQRAMVEVAARFAEKEIAPRVRDYDREERFPSEIYDMMGELGLTGGIIPEAYGGAGMSYVTYSLIIMELARHCQALAGAASWASGIVGASVLTFGTEEQKRRYLQPLAMGKGPAAFALTEPHTGSDVASLRTRAERVAGGYLLRGSKVWVSMIGSCHWMVALATVDPKLGRKGVTAFILEPGWKGLIRNPFKNKLGFRPMETGEIVFDDVFVPEENRLGAEGEGFRVAMCAVEGGRLGVASRCCGMIRACLEESVSYAKSRTTFGKPIAEYQLIQSKITDMSVAYETSRLLTLQLASLKDTGGRAREQASMAKMHASDMLMRSAEQAMQIHGAYGCSDEYAVGRLFRDAKFMQVIEGTNEIHRVLIAEYAAGLRH
jgi:alkylation response protein AidB-like acyl-CoA dehydrogenase